jgi:hypothetical protein
MDVTLQIVKQDVAGTDQLTQHIYSNARLGFSLEVGA